MILSKAIASATMLAVVGMGALAVDHANAAVLYSSSFTGTDGQTLDSTSDWMDTWNTDSANISLTISGNEGLLSFDSAVTGNYAGVKAEIGGNGATFDPSTSNPVRFQIDLTRALDTRSRTTDNIYFVQYLTPTNMTSQPYNVTPERILLFGVYTKGSVTNSSITLYLQQAKGTGSGNGVQLWTTTIPVNGTIETAENDPAHTAIQLAVEMRNDAAGDVRAGYQTVVGGSPQGWNYSSWYNVEGSSQPFDSSWATNWANATQWYLEIGGGGASGSGVATAYFDNAIVTGTPVPEPTAAGLILLGSAALLRRKSRID